MKRNGDEASAMCQPGTATAVGGSDPEGLRDRLAEALAVAFRHVKEGLLLLDGERRVALANPAGLRLLGLEETPLGMPFHELIRECGLTFPASPGLHFLDQFLPGQGVAGLALRANRTNLDLELSAYGVWDERARSAAGTVILLRDVTAERKRHRAREDFLSTAAHEIRTPLSALSTFVQLLRRPDYPKRPEQLDRILGIMERNVVRMTEICRDLLDLSRLTSGSFPLKPARVDFAAIVEAVLAEMQVLFAEKGVMLKAHLASTQLDADPTSLQRVPANLVGNALKFAPPGTVVTLRTWPEAGAVCFSVRDEGPGIPPDRLSEVFEPFYQVGGDKRAKAEGFGLGLAIAKGIVEAHGGSITAWSKPGEGAVFTVRLPAG